MKRTATVIAGTILALSAPLTAQAATEPAWHVDIPAGRVDVDFRQHSNCGAGRISVSAGYYSSNVRWILTWPKRTNGWGDRKETAAYGDDYSVTKHPRQTPTTRTHRGPKVYGTVHVDVVGKPGYTVKGQTHFHFKFRKPAGRGC